MKAKKVKGFNDREQRVYEMLAKDPASPKSFKDMKVLFDKEAKDLLKKYDGDLYKDKKEIDAMAQSLSRNAVRRLVRDGWAEQCGRGTYRLTRTGKTRLERGEDTTSSFGAKKGRPKKEATAKKAAAPKKKAPVKAAPKKKAPVKAKPERKAAKAAPKKEAKAAPKKEAKAAPKKEAKRKAAKAKGNGVAAKAKEAAKRAVKEAAKSDTQAAAKSAAQRVAEAASDETQAN